MVDPQVIVQGLVQRGVPVQAAYALAGNMAVESNYNPGINEINPTVPGSRGGYGLMQWTGPRRREFEQYAGSNVSDLDTQLDFLVQELGTTERRARDAIYSAGSLDDAARLVSERFLRPGIPHLDKRIEAARRVAGGQPQNSLASQPQSQPTPPNALAYQQQQPQQPFPQLVLPDNRLNAADYMSQTQFTNRLAGI